MLGHVWVYHLHFDSTQFIVYNGVTHDPQNPSVVE